METNLHTAIHSDPSNGLEKKNVTFETAKSTCAGIGMSVIGAATADGIYNSWRAGRLKPPISQAVCELVKGKITIAFTVAVGVLGFANAVQHNRDVAKFSAHSSEEQEKQR